MQFKLSLVAFSALFAANLAYAAEGDVHTVLDIQQTIIDQDPFIVDVTSTIIYTQGPSVTATGTPVPTLADETVVFGDELATGPTPAPEV
ncbi:hypothetical protein FA15DRAFT_761425 [Coprinopsis marcescibilis]|uniref:Uncharacterized protein n=1 Tax=Coprinopsis marcescibilis TaxID=230819 RepID=A0A5C3K9B0_COPMA|nr:hypothetical protein FA15DRAFT_761425 [Coprinopsis marcescibilis]